MVTLHEEITATALWHKEQWGERAEHLSVPVDLRDLEEWAEVAAALRARLADLEAEVAALRAPADTPPWRTGPRG